MKLLTPFQNFSRGKVDHDCSGRFDLPIYNSGADLFKNWISNFKGNAIFRAGYESMLAFQDCTFIEFKFSATQNYLMLFYANKIRFLAYDTSGNFGYVLSAGTPLEVATPYSLAETRQLQYTQNADVMILTHPAYPPRKLTRTSSNSFTLNTFTLTNDPFVLGPQKTISLINLGATTTITANSHGYTTGKTVKFNITAGTVQLNGQTAVATVIDGNTFTVPINSTGYSNFQPNGIGNVQEVFTNEYPACCLFYKGRLYYAATTKRPTTVFGSVAGRYDDFTSSAPIDETTGLVFTIADISQKIEWLFPGDNSLIAGAGDAIVAINGGSVSAPITAETVSATLTSAEGASAVYPFKKDGLIFYVSRDLRRTYYFSYDLLTESFVAKDANVLSYDITAGLLGKIRYKRDKNDLAFFISGDGQILTLNFRADENIIGWHNHDTAGLFRDLAVIGDNLGNQQVFALTLRNGTYFIERQAQYVEFKELSKFFTGVAATDKMAYLRYASELLRKCIYLDNSQNLNNLQNNTITYNAGAGTITATTGVFSAGSVGKNITYQSLTGYEGGRFQINGYVSPTVVNVSVLQAPTQNSYTNWYLSFSSISGLTQYEGMTIGVVTDGGYLNAFLVTGGTVNLGKQVNSAVVGYLYRGIIKSFCLGVQVQGNNTQTTMKAVTQFGMRCVFTAGLKVGTSQYRLEDVQDLRQGDVNYLPPALIDGTKYVVYTDDAERDKYFYIVQDLPLPATVAAALLNTAEALE